MLRNSVWWCHLLLGTSFQCLIYPYKTKFCVWNFWHKIREESTITPRLVRLRGMEKHGCQHDLEFKSSFNNFQVKIQVLCVNLDDVQNSCDWTPHQLLQQEPSEDIPKFTAILCLECHSLGHGDVSASYIYMSICAPQLCSTNGSLSTIPQLSKFLWSNLQRLRWHPGNLYSLGVVHRIRKQCARRKVAIFNPFTSSAQQQWEDIPVLVLGKTTAVW